MVRCGQATIWAPFHGTARLLNLPESPPQRPIRHDDLPGHFGANFAITLLDRLG